MLEFMEKKENKESFAKGDGRDVVSKSLEVEQSSFAEREKALSEFDRLVRSFNECLTSSRGLDEKKDLIKQKFSKSSDPQKLDDFFLYGSDEMVDALFKAALLSDFFWGKEGYKHEMSVLLEKFKKEYGKNALEEYSKYLKKYGQNNLCKTFETKMGDCNRLGTILIGIARSNGIDLCPLVAEAHFATAIRINGMTFVLDTENGELYFEEDFENESFGRMPNFEKGKNKFIPGDSDLVFVENLRDEFLSTFNGGVGEERLAKLVGGDKGEIERLLELGQSLLGFNLEKLYGEELGSKFRLQIKDLLEALSLKKTVSMKKSVIRLSKKMRKDFEDSIAV